MASAHRMREAITPNSLTAASSSSRVAAAPGLSHDVGSDRGSAPISVKGVGAFLAIAFGLAWVVWVAKHSLGVGATGIPSQILEVFPAFAPATACLIVRKWITREGFADAGLKVNLRHWPYYLIAWLLPLVVVPTVIGLALVLNFSQPDLSFQRAFNTPTLSSGASPSALPAAVPWPLLLMIAALLTTPIFWGEEFGWRGYLQVRLLGRQPLAAAVATGLLWGLWHAPLYLLGNSPERPLVGLPIFLVSATLLSIIFGWLRLSTGSVWSTSLAHAATNTLGGTLLGLLFIGGPNWVLVNYTGVLSMDPP